MSRFWDWLKNILRPEQPPLTPVPPEPTLPDSPPPGPVQSAVVVQFNFERGRLGLNALKIDEPLAAVAQSWANQCAARGYLSHDNMAQRIGSVYPARALGEIVAAGQPDANSVVDSWMSSPKHRDQILGDYTLVGIGLAMAKDRQPFWCASFVR